MEITVEKSKEELSRLIADEIISLVKTKPSCVLGLATGSSPILVYKYLIEAYKAKKVSFKHVKTFNLDEYINYKEYKDSYHYFMDHNLFDYIDLERNNIHFPNPEKPEEYDKDILKAGIDLQLLGIGADGHIGFNEPNTSFDSITNITTLTKQTIKDNARFFKSIEDVPTHAVTMGLKTILSAKEIILIATGSNKKDAISKLLKGEDISCPASILNRHSNVTLYLDNEAAKDIHQNNN